MGTQLEDSGFHVLLGGAKVGPYDRRTIVGMRIKQTLTSDHVLIASDGSQLTVADLIGQRPAEPFNANRSGVFSVVRATYGAALVEADARGLPIPRFKGEIEARVQADVLRLAGRFRRGLRWREDRVKLPLADVVHARIRGSVVDLWLSNPSEKKLQHLALELFTPAAAGDLVEWFPNATAYPEAIAAPATPSQHGLWIAIGGIAIVVGVILTVLLWPRG